MATRKPKRALTDTAIDALIRRNIRRFAKPGVVSVRPGIRIRKGLLTQQAAIVASVRRKLKNLPASETLPSSVGGVPVDVRPTAQHGSPSRHRSRRLRTGTIASAEGQCAPSRCTHRISHSSAI